MQAQVCGQTGGESASLSPSHSAWLSHSGALWTSLCLGKGVGVSG